MCLMVRLCWVCRPRGVRVRVSCAGLWVLSRLAACGLCLLVGARLVMA